MNEDTEMSEEELVLAKYVDAIWEQLDLDNDEINKSDFEELLKLGVAVATRQQDT